MDSHGWPACPASTSPVAQHVVQRGNHRQARFADDADYLHYRHELGEAALNHDCDLHAYG